MQISAQKSQYLIAVQTPPQIVADNNPVTIAVKRNTHIRLLGNNRILHQLCRRRTAIQINIAPVGGNADCHNFRSQAAQQIRRKSRKSAIGAIKDDFHSLKRHSGKTGFDFLLITRHGRLVRNHTPNMLRIGTRLPASNQSLNP